MTKTTLLSSSSNKCALFNTRRRKSKENYQKHDGDSNNEQIHADEQTNQSHQKNFEENLTGQAKDDEQIGDSVERNINQMIEALRSKISAMGNAAKIRLRLCQEDLNDNSRESSDQARKITEEYEESPKLKGTRDQEVGSSLHRDNLVLSEVVHINTAHLVIRTKATTDAAKKLEVELEDPYSSSKQRFIENTNGKSGQKKIEISKKNVQKRFEARKIRRNKSEKDLQTNMEKFLTRSVMDADLQFRAPIGCTSPMEKFSSRSNTLKHDHTGISETCNTTPTDLSRSEQENSQSIDEDGLLTKAADLAVAVGTLDAGVGVGVRVEGVLLDQEVNWPISIKWPPGDPRSGRSGNADGAMDPALLLRYAVEKIHLPSGETMFYWLGRQLRIQQYFVYLFWLVKVKLFERRTDCDNESYLIRELSVEHVHIMELLGSYGRGAQYEKDFAYQYLPYVLANAVYYGFHYLCPGSRNIYTRAFKKIVLLQVVKIMHGVQLCNATVKVLWSRLFPEDTVEVEDAAEEACEVIPVHIAVVVNNEGKYRAESAGLKSFHPCIDERVHEGNRTASFVQTEQSSKYIAAANVAAAVPTAPSSTEYSSSLHDLQSQNLIRKPVIQVKDRFFLPDLSLVPLPLGSAQLQCEEGVAPGQRQSLEAEHTLSSLDGRHMALDDTLSVTRCSMTPCSTSESVVTLNLLNPDKFSTMLPDPHASQILSCRPDYPHDGGCDRRIGTPLSRTQLRAQTLPHGHKLRALSRRQATETINMKSVSPLIQEYFSSSIKGPLKMDFRGGQLMQRTVPVSWYATGGVDTHRKGALHDDLHQNITDSRKEVEMDFRNASLLGRNSRMEKLRRATDTCHSLLQSDPATISVFSRAIVMQQQCRRRTATATASTGDPVQTQAPKGTTDSDLMSHKDALQSASFDPFELDCFIAGI